MICRLTCAGRSGEGKRMHVVVQGTDFIYRIRSSGCGCALGQGLVGRPMDPGQHFTSRWTNLTQPRVSRTCGCAVSLLALFPASSVHASSKSWPVVIKQPWPPPSHSHPPSLAARGPRRRYRYLPTRTTPAPTRLRRTMRIPWEHRHPRTLRGQAPLRSMK
jgi:hypothetical protein